MISLKKYLKVWGLMTRNAFETALMNRKAAVILIAGKTIRFGFFLVFLILLTEKTQSLAGYSLDEVVFLFLTFNFVDMTTQLFLRGIYLFRGKIVSGSFDFILLKPLNPLFMTLFSQTDVFDLATWLPLTIFMIYFALNRLEVTIGGLLLYLFLIGNSLVLALAIHILVAAIGILTTEVDHTIMIFRDFANMGKVPIEIYAPGVRVLLTFVLPVAILTNWPAKGFLGVLTWQMILYSVILTAVLFLASLKCWRYALSQYSSASS